MDPYLYIFIIFFLKLICLCQISASNCTQVNDRTPKLTVSPHNQLLVKNVTDNWLEIPEGEDLVLICQGNESIIWHLTDIDLNSPSSKDFIREHITFNDSLIDGKYVSELTVKKITSEVIGDYSCHYKNNYNGKDPKSTMLNSVYVFVKDKEFLFSTGDGFPDYPNNIIAVNNSLVKHICRPTSSFTEVSLWKWNGPPSHNYTQLVIGPKTGIEFDPRNGFNIQRIQNHIIKCVAKLEDKEETNIKEFQFYDGLKYDPVVVDLNKTFLFIGDNFTLNCLMRLEDAPHLSLDWKFHDQCFNEQEHRLIKGGLHYIKLNQIKYLSINVTVVNAQLNDSGVYVCSATDAAHEVREVTKIIQIFESPKLELSSNYENDVSLDFKQKFVLNITIDSVPNDERALTLKWTKNGYPLSYHQNERLSISRVDLQFATLIINSTKCEDRGLYRVEANLLDMLVSNISIRITVKNCDSDFKYQETKYQSEDKSDLIALIVIFVIFGSVLLFMALYIGQKIRKARRQRQEFEILSYNLFENGQMEMINPDIPLDEQIDLLPYDKRCEFPRDNLQFGQILGQGAFGRVVKAEAFGIKNYYQSSTSLNLESTTVAVKMLKERADISQRKALLAELKILIHVGKHMNIVNLLGAVTKDLIKGELLVIVEYCMFGNIRSFLMEHRTHFLNQLDENNEKLNLNIGENEPKYYNINESFTNEYQNVVSITEMRGRKVTTCDLINYVFQCAKGMEYLSSKKLIHRDLAARNVLLADDHIVKICDFGLARECYNYDNYVKKGEGPLPIKWMAIESMRDKVYTEKSDVWSFGVFMWEIFTMGSNPYPGFELDEQFYKKLVDGYRMGRPQFAPNSIYCLMKNCWLCEPNDRPDFTTLSAQLKDLMDETYMKRYENQLENYNKVIEENNCSDEYLKMSSNHCQQQNESYVDMTIDRKGNDRVVFQTIQNIENKALYDEVKNVRSIYMNTTVPKEPMEVVPMIQL